MGFTLKPLFSTETLKVKKGTEVSIGRYQLGINSHRISRNHLQLFVDDNNKLFAKQLGSNASVIVRNGMKLLLMKGEKIEGSKELRELFEDDKIFLLDNEFCIQVMANDEKTDFFETEKTEELKKTVCKYGSNCYQKNKYHQAKYSHPEENTESNVKKKRRVSKSIEDNSDLQEFKKKTASKQEEECVTSEELTQIMQEAEGNSDSEVEFDKLEIEEREKEISGGSTRGEDTTTNEKQLKKIVSNNEIAFFRFGLELIKKEEFGFTKLQSVEIFFTELVKFKNSFWEKGSCQFIIFENDVETLNILKEFAGKHNLSYMFQTEEQLLEKKINKIELNTSLILILDPDILKNEKNFDIKELIDMKHILVFNTYRFQPLASSKFSSLVHNLDKDLKSRLPKIGDVSSCYLIQTSENSVLRQTFGTKTVFHCIPSNLNPKRVNFCEVESEGVLLLRQTFQEVFFKLVELVGVNNLPKNAFEILMQKIKKPDEPNSKQKENHKGAEERAKNLSFRKALDKYCLRPESFMNNSDNTVVYFDKDIVVISDLFPKSKHHYLAMPREIKPIGVAELGIKDLVTLRLMKSRGVEIANQ
ncbi:hypothetical protein HDU92_007625 [Lobulomyces angularis]|nr:hypothetical protein HDU92_007625 [Lobulomyces angularis]